MPLALREKIVAIFAEGFRLQIIFTTGVIGLSLVTALMVWRKRQLVAAK